MGKEPIAAETSIGPLLRRLRRAASMSQEELAERAGISTQAVSALERGDRRRPYPRTLRALLDALGASDEDRLALLAAAAGAAPATGREAAPRPAQLPADAGDFTGRARDVGAIVSCLRRLQAPASATGPICAIAGKAGAGKSTLAVHVAHRLRADFPDAQLYADLRGQDARPRSPAAVLVGFLRALGVRSESLPQQLDEQATLYRSLLDGRRALVLLDNAHDEGQVRPLLPGAATCAVLVTARQRLVTLAGAELHDLADLGTADAVALLGAVAGRHRVERDPEAAERIAGFCGQLPLAVRIAGAVMRSRPHRTLATLADRLADERTRLDELRAGDLDVRASFALSHAGLAQGDARVFRLLALLPGASFSPDLVAALIDGDQDTCEDVLDRLGHAQLVQITGDGRYRLHDLIRLFARECLERAEPRPSATAAVDRMLDRVLAAARGAAAALRPADAAGAASAHPLAGGASGATRPALAYFEAEWASLVQAAARAAEWARWELALGLVETLEPFFALQAHWQEEDHAQRLGLRAARELADRPAERRMLAWMGASSRAQARWPEATSHFHASLEIARAIGDRHGEAEVLAGLGGAYRQRGELGAARRCLEASVAIFRELGATGPEGGALSSLGVVLSNQGSQDEAIACYERALSLLRAAGDRHAEGAALINLGDDLCFRGRWEDAAGCFERQLMISEDLHDADCASLGMAGLAGVRRHQRRFAEAMDLGQRALTAARASGDRRYEIRALEAIGATHRAMGRGDEAVDWYRLSLAIHRERGARQNECWALNRIGDVRSEQGRWEDAAAVFERSLAIAAELRAPHEERTILRRLADAYHALGRPVAAAACRARGHAIDARAGSTIPT